MDMIASRNRSTHTYNEETAESIFELIVEKYYQEFELFRDTFSKFAEREG
jgi:hypothetical protein